MGHRVIAGKFIFEIAESEGARVNIEKFRKCMKKRRLSTTVFAVQQEVFATGTEINNVSFRTWKGTKVIQVNLRDPHASPSMIRIVSIERRACKAPRKGCFV